MKKIKTELLSPAGSYEAFEAAIGAGADAVYVGGPAFGARAYARNFTREELITAIETAHVHGKQLYLTVNTLLKNRELENQLFDYLAPYYEAGLDAVIVQDMGVFSFIRRNFPDLPIHASTQMTVTGPEGMRFLEEKGATRVVPARELSIEEIRAMHEASSIEIETFVHGALCYSYSGQCLMSSMFGGRSGNRGRCAQPCRLPYRGTCDHKKYKGGADFCALSLKDICTLDILPDILDAGVMSLKIEGRMKQPSYTAGVTAIYRKYLDMYLSGGKYCVKEEDRRYLLELFSRGGSCSGYYDTYRGPEMMAFANDKKSGNLQPEIRKIKEKIHGNLILSPESPVILEVSCGDVTVSAFGGEVQFARNQPMEEQRIRQQMEKLGNTDFQWEKLNIEINGQIFVPVKVLNEVRRDALIQLREALIHRYRRVPVTPVKREPSSGTVISRPNQEICPPVYVSCRNKDVARLLINDRRIAGMYLEPDAMEAVFSPKKAAETELYLSTPEIHRGKIPEKWLNQAQIWIEQGMKGFLVRNMESYSTLRKLGYAGKCVLDASMYTWNDESVDFWKRENILRNTVPLELNEGELRHRDNDSSEMIIYGYIPLMISAQCVRKNLFNCNGKGDTLYLKDRYGTEFPVKCVCDPWKVKDKPGRYCYNIIYNSLPFGLPEERAKVQKLNLKALRLSFTVETPEEAKGILDSFLSVYQNGGHLPGQNYTKGHFKRGAE